MGVVTPDKIFEVMSGFMRTQVMCSANDIGFFEKLGNGPATIEELTQRISSDYPGVNLPKVEILADNIVEMGFVQCRGGLYWNGPVVDRYLSGKFPEDDFRPFLKFFQRLSYVFWGQLGDALKSPEPIFGKMKFDTPELQKVFSEGVAAITRPTAYALAAVYDFRPHSYLVDLGGGTGSFLIPMLNRHQHMTATLFEWPHVASLARESFAGHELANRIAIVAGDFFIDPIPDGHDAVLIANVVHHYSPERNVELFRIIRKGVPDGARLLLVDFWADKAWFAKLMGIEFLLFSGGEGRAYRTTEVMQWPSEAGWRVKEYIPLAYATGLIVAEAC